MAAAISVWLSREKGRRWRAAAGRETPCRGRGRRGGNKRSGIEVNVCVCSIYLYSCDVTISNFKQLARSLRVSEEKKVYIETNTRNEKPNGLQT